jgi:hypothetical protein
MKRIIVQERSSDYHASLEGQLGVWDAGQSIALAVGKLILSNRSLFGIEVVANTKDCEKARRLYNTVAGCGNDLTVESSQWLKGHLASCATCVRTIKYP